MVKAVRVQTPIDGCTGGRAVPTSSPLRTERNGGKGLRNRVLIVRVKFWEMIATPFFPGLRGQLRPCNIPSQDEDPGATWT